MSEEAIVRVEGVSRRFRVPGGTLTALADVSFSVRGGQTVGIVGESGCGKSTLSRILSGIDRPSAGRVSVGGAQPGTSRADRRRFATLCQMVFQDPYSSLNPRLRVGQIVAEPLLIHGRLTRAQRDREVARLLERVGLPRDASGRHPHALSGGQRQRVGIARALALRPRVIVADEPVSALDVSVQAQVLNLLADLRDDFGLTLILVSHDLQVVEWMSERVLVMYLGRIVEDGPRDAVFDHPEHPYTRALLAAAPGRRRRDDPERLSGEVPSPLNPPKGCAFHPRCPLVRSTCAEDTPPLVGVSDQHRAACVAVTRQPSFAEG